MVDNFFSPVKRGEGEEGRVKKLSRSCTRTTLKVDTRAKLEGREGRGRGGKVAMPSTQYSTENIYR